MCIGLFFKMAETWLTSMEQRLDELENRVFGASDKEVNYPKDAEKMIDTVVNLNGQIDEAVAGKPKIERTMGKLSALDKFMDPEYADKLTLSRAAKAEIIIAEEDELKKQAKNFEEMKSMMEVLSSEHIKAVPGLQSKLQEISTKHIQQQDQTSELCDEVKDLFAYYNNVITLISKQFVQWDELVTKLEIASQVKKVDD